MKATFIISEIILISSALLAFIFLARLSEEALMSSQFLFIAAFVMAIFYMLIKKAEYPSFYLILFTIISLYLSFTLPSNIVDSSSRKDLNDHLTLANSLEVNFLEETAIYKNNKITGIKFKFSISSPNINKNKNIKISPVLMLPFLADEHDKINLSLLRTNQCGIINSASKCSILGNKDHISSIQWPPLRSNDEFYFIMGPIVGDSIAWMKKNHKGHYTPPSSYFEGINRKLPLKLTLTTNKRRGTLLEKKFETQNKYDLFEIYTNSDQQSTINYLLSK